MKDQPNMYFDVFNFNEKFNLMRSSFPRHLTKAKLIERVKFMLEELLEFAEAAGLSVEVEADRLVTHNGFAVEHHAYVEDSGNPQDMAGMADALIDLAYVDIGTAVMMGLPWNKLWDDVQRANMSKVRGETHRGYKSDVAKPPNWVGPLTEYILKEHGYVRNWHSQNEVCDETAPEINNI